MNSRNILGYVSVMALATGAAVIGQNQPTSTPTRPPASTQPTTTQPGTQPSARPGDQTRWRDMADRIQKMNDRMADRNERLAQQLAQAQTQTGEARVNAIAEVLTGVLQDQEYTNRAITHLQRLVFRSHLESSNMSSEWDTWKEQYPFLDDSKDSKDSGDDATGESPDKNKPESTTPPRNPR
jgi:hypothetical protein